MTRDEEIWDAINNLQIGVYNENNSSDNDEYDGSDIQDAFYLGARWADENTKSLWISIKDDLPCNHEELLIKNKKETKTTLVIVNGRIMMGRMYKKRKWHWENVTGIEPTHWMLLPELPKE